MNPRTVLLLAALVYAGSLSATDPPHEAAKVTRLTLKQAVEMALSPGTISSQLMKMTAEAARGKVIAAKLATATLAQAALSDRIFRVDLRSLGIDIPRFSQLISTVQFPGANGPYSLLDPRIQAIKTLIDKSAKRKILAEKAGVQEAESSNHEEREKIAAETAHLYFDAVRASELVELAGENIRMAETMLRYAEEKRAHELATESEARRAKVSLNSERQKFSSAKLEQSRAVLRLMYVLGGDYGDSLELTDQLERRPPALTLEQAIDEALHNNPRLTTIQLHENKLKLEDTVVSAAWMPVVSAYGDVGMNIVAPDPSNSGPVSHSVTFTAGLEVKIPVLDGHRRALAHAGIGAELHQEQLKLRDLQRQIELDVRLAFASLSESNTQVELAAQSLTAAEADMAEIRADRAAGKVSGLELQQAEVRKAAAADGQIAALHAQAQARLALAQAMGNVATLDW
jgi:outer membrane protein